MDINVEFKLKSMLQSNAPNIILSFTDILDIVKIIHDLREKSIKEKESHIKDLEEHIQVIRERDEWKAKYLKALEDNLKQNTQMLEELQRLFPSTKL